MKSNISSDDFPVILNHNDINNSLTIKITKTNCLTIMIVSFINGICNDCIIVQTNNKNDETN